MLVRLILPACMASFKTGATLNLLEMYKNEDQVSNRRTLGDSPGQ